MRHVCECLLESAAVGGGCRNRVHRLPSTTTFWRDTIMRFCRVDLEAVSCCQRNLATRTMPAGRGAGGSDARVAPLAIKPNLRPPHAAACPLRTALIFCTLSAPLSFASAAPDPSSADASVATHAACKQLLQCMGAAGK